MALGFAIIGTGRFAAARIAPALLRAQGCQLRAVVSRDRARAAAFAAEHGVPLAFDSLEAALVDRTIDAVWVATPHDQHRWAVEAAAAARKHVLCEKQLATTVEDAQAMVLACRRAGVALGTGFHLRHHPLHREARRLVETGALGNVAYAEAEWSLETPISAGAAWRSDPEASGGGIITATGVHVVDLLRYVLGAEPESVLAVTNSAQSPAAPVETAAVVTMQFAGGVLAQIRGLRPVHMPANNLLLQGTRALLTGRGTVDEAARGRLEVTGAGTDLSGVPAGTDMYARQAEAFARAAYAGEEPDASGWDGLRAVQVTEAVYESARTGRAVKLPPPSRR